VGSFVKPFAESFDKKQGVAVMLESCGQVVESYNVIVDFVTFLFESIEFVCGIFFDHCVDKTIDKGPFKIVPKSLAVARYSDLYFILECS